MNNSNKKYILTIGLIVLAIIALVFLSFFFLSETMQNSQDLVDIRKEIDYNRQKVVSLNVFSESYHKYEPIIQRTENVLIDPDSPVEVVRFLEEATSDLNLSFSISSISSSPARRGNDYWDSFLLSASAEGPLNSLIDFLEILEKGYYLFELSDMSVTKRSSDSEIVRASLTIKFFTEKP